MERKVTPDAALKVAEDALREFLPDYTPAELVKERARALLQKLDALDRQKGDLFCSEAEHVRRLQGTLANVEAREPVAWRVRKNGCPWFYATHPELVHDANSDYWDERQPLYLAAARTGPER